MNIEVKALTGLEYFHRLAQLYNRAIEHFLFKDTIIRWLEDQTSLYKPLSIAKTVELMDDLFVVFQYLSILQKSISTVDDRYLYSVKIHTVNPLTLDSIEHSFVFRLRPEEYHAIKSRQEHYATLLSQDQSLFDAAVLAYSYLELQSYKYIHVWQVLIEDEFFQRNAEIYIIMDSIAYLMNYVANAVRKGTYQTPYIITFIENKEGPVRYDINVRYETIRQLNRVSYEAIGSYFGKTIHFLAIPNDPVLKLAKQLFQQTQFQDVLILTGKYFFQT